MPPDPPTHTDRTEYEAPSWRGAVSGPESASLDPGRTRTMRSNSSSVVGPKAPPCFSWLSREGAEGLTPQGPSSAEGPRVEGFLCEVAMYLHWDRQTMLSASPVGLCPQVRGALGIVKEKIDMAPRVSAPCEPEGSCIGAMMGCVRCMGVGVDKGSFASHTGSFDRGGRCLSSVRAILDSCSRMQTH
jgi:hypothetical protein